MKNEERKNKVEEPFDPERTPEPAQVKNPNERKEQGQKNQPTAEDDKQRDKSSKQREQPSEKKLGESPIEIDDETTI